MLIVIDRLETLVLNAIQDVSEKHCDERHADLVRGLRRQFLLACEQVSIKAEAYAINDRIANLVAFN